MPRLFIFDWDGTLHNSQHKIIHCMQLAARKLQLQPLSTQSVQNVIGLGLPEAIKKLLPNESDDMRDRCKDIYVDIFVNQDNTPTPFFDNVEDTLNTLKKQGHTLAIATGKSRRGLDRIMGDIGFAGIFSATRCADETASKPNPKMLQEILHELNFRVQDAIMVGDSIYDMEMARNINMPKIAVNYGVHSEVRLAKYQPFMIISKISDISLWEKHNVELI